MCIPVSRIICHDIDDTVIGYFTKFAFHLLRLDIETGKQRAVFSERLVTVGTEYALDDIGYLFLHVTALVVRFLRYGSSSSFRLSSTCFRPNFRSSSRQAFIERFHS